MNRSRAPAFRSASAFVGPKVRVLIVGSLSRTWYADQSVLIELFSWLSEEGAVPIVIGSSAFELTARAASTLCDKPVATVRDSDQAGVDRSIAGAGLCVVLVPRKTTSIDTTTSFEEAGPVVGEARRQGVPLLALYDNGDADFFPVEQA